MGQKMRLRVPHNALRTELHVKARWSTEVLYGEEVEVVGGITKGYYPVRTVLDGREGFLVRHALVVSDHASTPTHRVQAMYTIVRAEAHQELPPVMALDINALVAVKERCGQFALIKDLGYVPSDDLAPIGAYEPDWVAAAEKFLGTPYLLGGRTTRGIDSAGLVQTARIAAGFECPHSCAEISGGMNVGPLFRGRGDLVFWPDHVGVMVDAYNILHATTDFMRVVVESYTDALLRRRANGGGEVTSIKRL